VALPEPKPGLVIRYAYLWGREADQGAEEASKDRPCAVVLASRREGEETRVIVAPITRAAPGKGMAAIEVPADTKRRLGLDHQRSWIITSEVNVFNWPGPDIRPVPGRPGSPFLYGYLPTRTAQAMIDGVNEQRRRGQLRQVRRDENSPQKPRERGGGSSPPAAPSRDFRKRERREEPSKPEPDQGQDRPRHPKRKRRL
jgi:mRNA-degrading endonuclease toxin of MazEF toxin-antitoxin module